MIRLVVTKGGVQNELDLYGDEKLPITYTVDDFNNFEGKTNSYSKEFDLPATKRNNLFFENIQDLQSSGSFNILIGYDVSLYIDSSLVFEGLLYLLEVVKKGADVKYKVNLMSEAVKLLDNLGDATLSDLSFSDYKHNFTGANVTNSQDTTGVTLTAGGTTTDIYYSLTNNTQLWLLDDVYDMQSPRHYQPYVRLKAIIDKIFTYAGMSYTSTFFDSDLFKSVFMDTGLNDFAITGNTIVPAHNKAAVSGTFTHSHVGGFVALASTPTDLDIQISQTLGTSFSALTVSNEPATFLGSTNDGNNIMSGGVITAPSDNFVFNLNVQIPIWALESSEITVIGRLSGGADIQLGTVNTPPTSGSVWGQFLNTSETYALFEYDDEFTIPTSGQTCTIMLKSSDASASYVSFKRWYWYFNAFGLLDFVYGANPGGAPLNLLADFGGLPASITATPIYQEDGIHERIVRNHGDVKLSDIIKDVCKMYNLIVEPTTTGQLKIEPYVDYVSGGVDVDWTKKIDTKEIIQNYEGIPSSITWSYNNDEDDHALNTYRAGTGQEYGTFELTLQTDYNDAKEIKLEVFSATVWQYNSIGAATNGVFSYEEGVYASLENSPRLLFKPGTFGSKELNDRFDITDDSNYSAGSHFEDFSSVLGFNAHDLNFGYTTAYFISGGYTQPINNLFNKYWKEYVTERYTADRVLVKARIHLTPADIELFSFANDVIIKNQKYRVNKIEYNAGQQGTAKVELLRLL